MRIKRFLLLAQFMLATISLLAACAGGPSLPPAAPTMTTEPKIRPSATLAEPPRPTPTGQFFNHEVAERDTCETIAAGYGISVQALIDVNGLAADCSDVYLGQVLFIPHLALGTPEQDRLTLSQAEELVRAQIFADQPDMNPAARFPLVEITTDEVWQQLGAQVFKVRGEVLLNQGYVIREGQVAPQVAASPMAASPVTASPVTASQVTEVGESFGGNGVHTLLLADLDGAPPAELVYAHDFGSGLQLSGLGVYRVDGDGGRAHEIREFRYPGALALELRDGVVVIHGTLDRDGVRRELGRLLWADGRAVVVPAE